MNLSKSRYNSREENTYFPTTVLFLERYLMLDVLATGCFSSPSFPSYTRYLKVL